MSSSEAQKLVVTVSTEVYNPARVLYIGTGVFGGLFIVVPLLIRKGPDRGIIRCCIMMTIFCLWIFWATVYVAQMRPLIAPRMRNTTMAWIKYQTEGRTNKTNATAAEIIEAEQDILDPIDGDTGSAAGDPSSPGGYPAPSGVDNAPSGGDTSPSGEDTSPSGGYPAPSGGDTSPSGGEPASSGGDTAPSVADTAPSTADTAPSTADTAPSGVDTLPSGGDSSPSGVDTAPSGADTSPAGGHITPSSPDPASSDEDSDETLERLAVLAF